jgi:hypothetical protein
VRTFNALIAAALVLAAAGCGGGGKSSSSTTTSTPGAQTTTTATTTTASGSTTTPNVSGIASASNCRELASLSGQLAQAFGGAPSGDTKRYAAFLHAYADRAPKEIRPDFQTLASAYDKMSAALGDYTPGSGRQPTAAQLAKLMKALQGIDQAKISQAGQHISAWAQKNCAHA